MISASKIRPFGVTAIPLGSFMNSVTVFPVKEPSTENFTIRPLLRSQYIQKHFGVTDNF